MELLVVALEDLDRVAGGDRHDQDRRRRVQAVHVDTDQAHESERPQDAQDGRRDRQQHALHAAERPVLDRHDDQQRGAEVHRHLHHVALERGEVDGQAADVDVDAVVALLVEDVLDLGIERGVAGLAGVDMEVRDDGHGTAIRRHEAVDVERIRLDAVAQLGDLLRRLRYPFHDGLDDEAGVIGLDVLDLAGGQAHHVLADGFRQVLDAFLDVLHLGQDRGLVDVAVLRHDPDEGVVPSAEDLLHRLRRLHVRMRLRNPGVLVHVDLQAHQARAERDGDDRQDERDRAPMADDKGGVSAIEIGEHGHPRFERRQRPRERRQGALSWPSKRRRAAR